MTANLPFTMIRYAGVNLPKLYQVFSHFGHTILILLSLKENEIHVFWPLAFGRHLSVRHLAAGPLNFLPVMITQPSLSKLF